jgi:hypothetical protein
VDEHTRIPVVDRNNRFLSYTHPARARKLLRDGEVEVFSTSPFTIRLKRTSLEGQMTAITNFTEYFKEERDIYVQNKSDRLISLEFQVSGDRKESHRLARTLDPVNLTQYIPFNAIKNSTDLRNLSNRQPPAIVFLSEEEYKAYFQQKAVAHETTMEEEISRSNEKHRSVVNRTAFKPMEKMTQAEAEKELTKPTPPEEQLTPRVVGLCSKVGTDIKEAEMLPARDFIEELENLEPVLTPADLEFVLVNGYHKAVKKWAQKRIAPSQED